MKNVLLVLIILLVPTPSFAANKSNVKGNQPNRVIIVPEQYLQVAQKAALQVSRYAKNVFTVFYKKGTKTYYVCSWRMTDEELSVFITALGMNYRKNRVELLPDKAGRKDLKPRERVNAFGLSKVKPRIGVRHGS
jgi:hypothetical protein